MIVSDIDMTGDWFCAEPEASKPGSREYANDVRWFRVRDNAVEIRRGWCGEPDIQGVQHIRLELGQFAAIAAYVNAQNREG